MRSENQPVSTLQVGKITIAFGPEDLRHEDGRLFCPPRLYLRIWSDEFDREVDERISWTVLRALAPELFESIKRAIKEFRAGTNENVTRAAGHPES